MSIQKILAVKNISKVTYVFQSLLIGIIPAFSTIGSYILGIKVPILFLWVISGVLIVLICYVLIDLIINVPFQQKKDSIQNKLSSLKICLLFLSILWVCLVFVVVKQHKNQDNLRDEMSHFMDLEQKYIFDTNIKDQIGIADFYYCDYKTAAEKIKQNINTNPIAEYYYGLMLFNGQGMQRDEQKGLEHIKKSADKHFFRAMSFMVKWGSNNSRLPDVIQYAESLIHACPYSVSCINDEEQTKKFAAQQHLTLISDCQNCYSIMYIYNIFIRKSYYKLWCLINDYDLALKPFNKQTNNFFYKGTAIDNAWGIWKLESKFLGKWYMWFITNIRYPDMFTSHFDYALMLLDLTKTENMDLEHISLDNVKKNKLYKAERELDKSLKISIRKKDIQNQYKSLQLLIKILQKTDREYEAERLSILVSNLKIKDYYEKLDN